MENSRFKFRAWDEVENEFVNTIGMGLSLLGLNTRYKFTQYTGLKDSKGVEIYEGDIVKVIFDDGEETMHKVAYGLEWQYPAFDLIPQIPNCEMNSFSYCYNSGYAEIEVIGNIYEHSNLLDNN